MSNDLMTYYQIVEKDGYLRTPDHARRWSTAVLKTLGVNLSSKTKKQLAKALPQELANDLTRVFWLIHFRNTNMSRLDFQAEVAKRSGNTDAQFAREPIKAVFRGLKTLTNSDTQKAVADSLSPELREMWQNA